MNTAAATAAPQTTVEALRTRILREATKLFGDRGYGATSMREVAEAADCTKPALYYHFTNKEALFLEIIRAETDFLTNMLVEAQQRTGNMRERMTSDLAMYFAHVRENAVKSALLMRAEMQPEHGQPVVDFRSLRQKHSAMVKTLLQEGVATGEIRNDVDLDDLVLMMTATCEAKCVRLVFHGEPIAESFSRSVTSMLFEGVSP